MSAVNLIVVYALGLFQGVDNVHSEGAFTGPIISPIAGVQAQLDELAEAFIEFYRDDDDMTVLTTFRKLREVKKIPLDTLIQQTVYYMGLKGSTESSAALQRAIFIFVRPNKAELLATLAPYFDSQDRGQRRSVHGIAMFYIEDDRGHQIPLFGQYASFLHATQGNPPLGLIEYMYMRDPTEALSATLELRKNRTPEREHDYLIAAVVVREWAYRQRKGLESEAAMSKPAAIEQVRRMAHDHDWTARLFAAACLWKYREAKVPELVELLGNDEHQLVKKFAVELSHVSAPD